MADTVGDLQDLYEAAETAFCEECPELCVLPVEPQPHLDAPVFLVTPPWAEGLNRVAICLQIHQRGRRPLISMEFTCSRTYSSDLRVPEEMQPAVLFFVGERLDPIREFERVDLAPGTLIRAFPPRVEPRRQESLRLKLQHAWDFFRDADVEGVPEPAFLPCRLSAADPSAPTIDEIAQCVDRRPHTFFTVEPVVSFDEVTLLGFPLHHCVGVVATAFEFQVPVFVDPRDVAQHVRVVVLPPVEMSITQFLRLSHVDVPSGYCVRLIGAAVPSSRRSFILPSRCDRIIVQVYLDPDSSDEGPGADVGDNNVELCRESHSDLDREGRSRSPKPAPSSSSGRTSDIGGVSSGTRTLRIVGDLG